MSTRKILPLRDSIRSAIFKLHDATEELDELYGATEGEVTDEAKALEAFLDEAGDNTLEALGEYVREAQGMTAIAKLEAKRLKAVVDRQVKRATWGEDLIRTLLERRGVRKLEVGTTTLSLRKKPETVHQVEAEVVVALVPEKFHRTIPAKVELDKAKIGKALKAGEAVDGFELRRNPAGVVIK